LIAAAMQGKVGVLRLLLDRGADLRLMTTDRKNCLESAISNGHHDVCMEIINHDRYTGQSQINSPSQFHILPRQILKYVKLCVIFLGSTPKRNNNRAARHQTTNNVSQLNYSSKII